MGGRSLHKKAGAVFSHRGPVILAGRNGLHNGLVSAAFAAGLCGKAYPAEGGCCWVYASALCATQKWYGEKREYDNRDMRNNDLFADENNAD